MDFRWDETWHRLLEWTNGQARSERLSAQILLSEGYTGLDPSHPLGGRDGAKDATCQRNGRKALMAVYFPRGKQKITDIRSKFLGDLKGVSKNKADEFVFVTNQELTLGQRNSLEKAAKGIPVALYHLERLTAILDKPQMAGIRKQFLGIEFVQTWPDPLIGAMSLEQLAKHIEAGVSASVEILAHSTNRLFVWMKPAWEPTKFELEKTKEALLTTACMLSEVTGIQEIDVGFSNTSALRASVGGTGIGVWRVRFAVVDAQRVATSKVVDEEFWKRVTVVITAGDNLRVGEKKIPFDEFERVA